MLRGMQSTLFWISIALGLMLIIVLLIVSTDLTKRLRKIIAGVRRVQNGAYGEQLPCEGNLSLIHI